jgi:hypothetical protein
VNPQQPGQIRFPSAEKVERIKNVLELVLLLLAFPWIIYKLFKDPKGLLENRESA